MKKLKTSLNYLNTKYYSLIRRFSVYSLYITHPALNTEFILYGCVIFIVYYTSI